MLAQLRIKAEKEATTKPADTITKPVNTATKPADTTTKLADTTTKSSNTTTKPSDTVNADMITKPIWTQNKVNISTEEYSEFYKIPDQ